MPEQQIAELGDARQHHGRQRAAPGSEALKNVAKILAKLFGVDPDEVAILKLNPKYKTLKFVIPEKLALVGTIPLTSTTALAARTARERKAGSGQQFQHLAPRHRL